MIQRPRPNRARNPGQLDANTTTTASAVAASAIAGCLADPRKVMAHA